MSVMKRLQESLWVQKNYWYETGLNETVGAVVLDTEEEEEEEEAEFEEYDGKTYTIKTKTKYAEVENEGKNLSFPKKTVNWRATDAYPNNNQRTKEFLQYSFGDKIIYNKYSGEPELYRPQKGEVARYYQTTSSTTPTLFTYNPRKYRFSKKDNELVRTNLYNTQKQQHVSGDKSHSGVKKDVEGDKKDKKKMPSTPTVPKPPKPPLTEGLDNLIQGILSEIIDVDSVNRFYERHERRNGVSAHIILEDIRDNFIDDIGIMTNVVRSSVLSHFNLNNDNTKHTIDEWVYKSKNTFEGVERTVNEQYYRSNSRANYL